MRWSRIKNIIILLLVIVNLFLLAQVSIRIWRTQQGERETRERMIEILSNNGIAFLPEEVPGQMPLTAWQVAMEIPGEDQAAQLVGELQEVQSVGARTTYIGAWGRATFSTTGEVEAEFSPGGWARSREQITAGMTELLNALGLKACRELERREENERVSVTVIQLWEGSPVFANTLTLTWEDGSFTHLSGRWLLGTGETAAAGEIVTSSTALARFLTALNEGGYVCSQITDLYAGYTASGTGTVNLTPAWFIETDVWPRYFVVDGVTGTVTAAE